MLSWVEHEKSFIISGPVLKYAKDVYRIWQVQNKADIGANILVLL